MPVRKRNRLKKFEYTFFVEGETEKYYLEHLQNIINNAIKDLGKQVKFFIYVERNVKKAARINKAYKNVFFLRDTETGNEGDRKSFNQFLEEVNKEFKENNISAEIGHSNLSIEVWLLRHKTQFNTTVYNNDKYVESINKQFEKNFENSRALKRKENILSIINQLSLDDVRNAISNEEILDGSQKNYFKNPSTSVGKLLQKIFNDLKIN